MLNKMEFKKYYYLLLFLLLLSLNSCGVISPKAPEIIVGSYDPPKQEVSQITIPIEMEMKSYFNEADKAVPYEFSGQEQQCEGVSFSYKFKRDPIKISGNPKKTGQIEVGIGIEGKYTLNLNYCAKCTDVFSSNSNCLTPRIYTSCGVNEPMRKISVEYQTLIDLKKDYKLDATTTLKEVTPKDKCQITVFNFDATGQLVKEVKVALKEVGKEIDKGVESVNLKKEVTSIWNTFTEPINLNGYGYLYFNPNQLAVNKLRLNGTKLQFDAVLEAFPKVSLVSEETKNNKLPDLSKLDSKEGFSINLDILANYDSLSQIINNQLNGKTITIKNNTIVFQDAKVYGANNNQLSISVAFTGSKSGQLFFVGTPVFNDSLQEISFPDMTFELETKNALLKSAKWLFNDKITDLIREHSKYSLTSILNDATKELNVQLNKKIDNSIILNGKVKSLKVRTVFPDRDKLIVQVNLNGILRVTLK